MNTTNSPPPARSRQALACKALGALQIVGSAWLLAVLLFHGFRLHPLLLGILVFMQVAGGLLWRGDRLGIQLGMVAQAAQVLIVQNDYFTWVVQMPLFVGVAFMDSDLKLRFMIEPAVQLAGASAPEGIVVGVNILAVGTTIFLASLLSKPPVDPVGNIAT